MNPIKEWFKKKKVQKDFKAAGPGHKLNDESNRSKVPQPSSSQSTRQAGSVEAQRAGAAALARLEQKQSSAIDWSTQALKAQVKKELEKESKMQKISSSSSNKVIQDNSTLSVSGVFFTCPLIGPEVLPKKEMKEQIRCFLYDQLKEEKGLTACLIIHTLNDRSKVQGGTETLCRYLNNIVSDPAEPKYRRIRLQNRVFAEKVQSLEGALEFLQAAGFYQVQEEGEEVLVFDPETPIEQIQMLMDALMSAEPIRAQLDRNLKVLRPSSVLEVNLPNDFYNLSLEEIKREQQARAEAVEQMTQLRTKAMRERDQNKELNIYKYTLVRVRFPDNIVLQGTFYVNERLSSVREFVAEHLLEPSRDFQLVLATGLATKLGDGTLLELKLVPAALLTFSWTSEEKSEVYLKPETVCLLSDQ